MGKIKCQKCKQIFKFHQKDTYWDEKGYGYSTKLVRCNKCNALNILKYSIDESLDINNDPRFYEYD